MFSLSVLHQSSDKNSVKSINLLTGAISGCVSRTCTNSFGRIKILKQCRDKMFLQLNFINSIKYLWRTEGFKGLFKGNFVNCIRVAPFTACEFAFYDLFKRILLKDNYPKKGFYMKRFLSGAMTGLIATTVTHPLDVLRTFISFHTSSYAASRFGTTNMSMKNAAKIILFANGGVIGFYRGYLVSCLGIIPHLAVKMASFDFFKSLKFVQDHKENSLIYLPFGGLAGALATTVSYPFDLLRKRFQIKDSCADVPDDGGILQSIRKIYKRKGIRGFYVGLTVNYWKVIPTVAIICMCNEYITAARLKHTKP